MTDKPFILTLAKVAAAAAWADGELALEEIEHLKDLVFRLSQNRPEHAAPISSDDWARLEMYMESPVDEAERDRLVAELQSVLSSAEERETAVTTLQDLIQADGTVTDSEQEVVNTIRQAIETAQPYKLGSLITQAVRRRHTPNREQNFDEYIKNQVFYAVSQRLNLPDSGIPEDDWRKLSLAGGLMARIANVDRHISPAERQAVEQALQAHWPINPDAASLVAEIAISKALRDMDYYRMTREFFNCTTPTEHVQFLHALFAIAAADGRIAPEESDSIRRIARSLQLRQSAFMQAKADFDTAH